MSVVTKNKVLYQIWFMSLLCYQFYIKLVYYSRLLFKILTRAFTNEKASLIEFQETIKKLPKIPNHVTVAFQYSGVIPSDIISEQYHHEKKIKGASLPKNVLNLKNVAEVASWLAVAPGVSLISLYDYYGILKMHHEELKVLIEQRLSTLKSLSISDKQSSVDAEDDPKVVIHNADDDMKKCCSYNGQGDPRPIVHVFLFSRCDGKPAILKTVENIYLEKKAAKEAGKPVKGTVDVATISSKLNIVGEHYKMSLNNGNKFPVEKTEPDLLINLGNIRSTLDFLPWHIKLTEIHFLPQVNHLQVSELLGSFMKYAKCEQRFGK